MTVVNGWTVLSPSSDSRLIYVSNTGNDTNAAAVYGRGYYLPSDPEIGPDPTNPVGPIVAYATPDHGWSRIRHNKWLSESGNFDTYQSPSKRYTHSTLGYPDWILYKRGDTFDTGKGNREFYNNYPDITLGGWGGRHGAWAGRSASEPGVMTAWGTPTDPRPVFTGNLGLGPTDVHIRYVSLDVLGSMAFGSYSLFDRYDEDVLVEDCRAKTFGANNVNVNVGLRYRRCAVSGTFNASSHNQGLFVSSYSGEGGWIQHAAPDQGGSPLTDVVFEECVFDRNGYKEDPYDASTWTAAIWGGNGDSAVSPGLGVQPRRTYYDRNIYVSTGNGPDRRASVTLRGCLFSRAGGGGSVQMRQGGVVDRCVWVGDVDAGFIGNGDGIYKDCLRLGSEIFHNQSFYNSGFLINMAFDQWPNTWGSVIDGCIVAGGTASGRPAFNLQTGAANISSFNVAVVNTDVVRHGPSGVSSAFTSTPFASATLDNNRQYINDPASSHWDGVASMDCNAAAAAFGAGSDPCRDIVSYMASVDPDYATLLATDPATNPNHPENVHIDEDCTVKQANRVLVRDVWTHNLAADRSATLNRSAVTDAEARLLARRYHAFLTFIERAKDNRKHDWDSRWTADALNNYIRGGLNKSLVTGDYDTRSLDIRIAEYAANAHGPVTNLVLTTQPSAGTSGDPLVTQPVVALRDADNITTVSDNTTQVSVAIQSGANGTLGGTTTVTVVNGVATFTDLTLTGDAGESYVLRFSITSPALHVDSNPISVTLPPGGGDSGEEQVPTTIVITTQPVPNYSGLEFVSQPVLVIEDQNGVVITSDNTSSVRATLNGSNGSLQGTSQITAVNGVYTFTNLSVTGDPNITYSLTFVSSEQGVNPVTSDNFNLLFDEPAPEIPSASPIPTVIRNDRYIPYLMSINIDGDFNRGDLLSLRVNQTQFMGTGTKEFIVNYRNTLLYNREQNYNIPEDWDVFWSKTLGPVKNPNQIAPCFAWYKPEEFTASDDGATYITLSNSSLYAANDPDDFLQETTSQQAGRTAYGLNGFIPLDFDGVDDVFVNSEDTDRFQLPLNTDFIFGFVVVPGASTGNEQVIFSQGGIGTDGSLQIILDDSNGNNRIKFNTQYDGTPETVLSGDGAYTVGNPLILIVSRIGGIVKFRSNGVEPGFPPQYSDIPYNTINTTNAAYIGAAFDADTETLVDFFSGDFYELVLLKETQDQAIDQLSYREELEGYFAEKYKVKSLLPSGHPFSINPPRASVIKEEVSPDETLPQYDCSITRTTVSNTQFDDTSHSGETIAVETQSDCQWKATTNNSWITLTNTAHIGNGTVNFSVAQHSGSEDRTGAITIITVEGIAETISITQTAVAGVQATGGTETTVGGYKYHTFTTGGTLTVTSGGDVEYLIVGGGGAGGRSNRNGGGGAGEAKTGTIALTAQAYTITIGAGGLVGTNGNGSSSSALGLTAIGGGNGGFNGTDGSSGGSGGGGGSASYGGTGTAGNDGGDGANPTSTFTTLNAGSGGGGGAGAAGSNVVSYNDGGDGGAGIEWPTGSGTYYAGGGGGSSHSGIGGDGGAGGGGGGGAYDGTAGSGGSNGGGNGVLLDGGDGGANTGGGGGGGVLNAGVSGNGGSGIVIIRYEVPPPQATGGTETTVGGYKYHTFTSDGTLTVSSGGTLEYLIVGGGGGGAKTISGGGGGGGGGGFLSGTTAVTPQSYTITVGAGGAASSGIADGVSGGDSTAFGLTANGGGYGGFPRGGGQGKGGTGGSGGGGGGNMDGTRAGGTGTAGQGNDGATGFSTSGVPSQSGGGGGGGAGSAGSISTTSVGGAGGAGAEWPAGSGNYYAAGGQAGHGNGSTTVVSGAANTGNGGSGSTWTGSAAGDGGSGIVIVRYPA